MTDITVEMLYERQMDIMGNRWTDCINSITSYN